MIIEEKILSKFAKETGMVININPSTWAVYTDGSDIYDSDNLVLNESVEHGYVFIEYEHIDSVPVKVKIL